MIRNEVDSGYGSDYAELIPLKALAEQLGITIVLIHHLRKAADNDPFNMISGSTGLNGCVDGLLVLLKNKRSGSQAVLHATGRDIEDQEIAIKKQGVLWVLADESEDKPPDTFPFAVHDLMTKLCSFKGSATELCELLKDKFGGEYFANRLTRDLFRFAYELQNFGVTFTPKRSNGQRLLLLCYDKNSDSSDGKKLMPEQHISSVPAVSAENDNTLQSPENTLNIENGSSKIGSKVTVPYANSTVPAEQFTDPVLSENFIDAVAHMLSNKLLAQGIKVRPFEGANGSLSGAVCPISSEGR